MRALSGLYKLMASGTWKSLGCATLLWIVGIATIIIVMIPAFQTRTSPIKLSEDDLEDLMLYSPFAFYQLDGEIYDADRRGSTGDRFGIIEVGSMLILAVSDESIDEDEETFIGTLQSTDIELGDVADDIVDELDLDGELAEVHFRFGEPDRGFEMFVYVLLAVVLAIGAFGFYNTAKNKLGQSA